MARAGDTKTELRKKEKRGEGNEGRPTEGAIGPAWTVLGGP